MTEPGAVGPKKKITELSGLEGGAFMDQAREHRMTAYKHLGWKPQLSPHIGYPRVLTFIEDEVRTLAAGRIDGKLYQAGGRYPVMVGGIDIWISWDMYRAIRRQTHWRLAMTQAIGELEELATNEESNKIAQAVGTLPGRAEPRQGSRGQLSYIVYCEISAKARGPLAYLHSIHARTDDAVEDQIQSHDDASSRLLANVFEASDEVQDRVIAHPRLAAGFGARVFDEMEAAISKWFPPVEEIN